MGAVPITGGTFTGKILSDGGFTTSNEINVISENNSGKIRLWSDNEGGNMQLVSPNGTVFEIDAYNNTAIRLRVVINNVSNTLAFDTTTQKLLINGKAVLTES